MRPRIAAIVLLSVPAFAQQPDSWDRLTRLRHGGAVQLHLRDGSVSSGSFVRVDPGELVIQRKRIEVAVPRTEIRKVTRRSRLRGALIGFAAGFAVGAPIGAAKGPYLADWSNPPVGVRLRFAGGFGLFAGGIGAGLGAVAAAHPTVYRAP